MEDKNLLRNLPPTPDSAYIIRKQVNDTICNRLKTIDKSSGRIVVCGISGSGKTISVCQCVRHVIENGNCFKSQGCYWLKIGNISDDELLIKLKSMVIDLGYECNDWAKSPKQMNSETIPYLKCDKEYDKEMTNMLFIFDDVCNPQHYEYLTFAKKSIITSRCSFKGKSKKDIIVPMEEQFQDNDIAQLLQNRRMNSYHRTLENDQTMQTIIQRCNRLPLAVDMIVSLHLEGFTDWKLLSTIIDKRNLPSELKEYKFNILGLFKLSINQLNVREKQLFHLLGVFKAESIQIQSIMSLWNVNEAEAVALLQQYHRRSLLKYNENRCCLLHDLMIDYLQRPSDMQLSSSQYRQQLCKTLIDCYASRCQHKWSTYPPDDDYFYRNVVYHALLAEDDVVLEEMMSDFNWMGIHLKICKMGNCLSQNIIDYMDYLKRRNQNWQKWTPILHLLQAYELALVEDNVDFIQVLLMYARKYEWLRQRTEELARQNMQDYNKTYWTVDSCPSGLIAEKLLSIPMEIFDLDLHEKMAISVSEPRNGQLLIFGIWDSEEFGDSGCQIMVKDYYTCQTLFYLSRPEKEVTQNHISLDGHMIAFQDNEKWFVYNVETGKELHFAGKMEKSKQKVNFDTLQFRPVRQSNSDIIATISSNGQQLQIWNMVNNEIKATEKQISCPHQLKWCQWLQNGEKLMLWWGDDNIQGSRKKKFKSSNSNQSKYRCQSQIWNLDPWQCMKSFQVPQFIVLQNGLYLPTDDCNDGLPLESIRYLNNGVAHEYIILIYQSVVGLLRLEDDNSNDIDFVQDFKRHFRPILEVDEDDSVCRMNVSDSQQYITIDFLDKSFCLKIINDQIQECVVSQKAAQSTFIPGSDEILVHTEDTKMYKFNLQDKEIHWKMAPNRRSETSLVHEYLENPLSPCSGCAHINGVPIVAYVLDNDGDNPMLKVCDYSPGNCVKTFHHSIDVPYVSNCLLFDNLSAIILCSGENEDEGGNTITFTKITNFCSENGVKKQTLVEYKEEDEDGCLGMLQSRYREMDHTLICILSYDASYRHCRVIVLMINLETGSHTIYKEDSSHLIQYCLYLDDFYLIMADGESSKKNRDDVWLGKTISLYQLSKGGKPTQLIKTQTFDGDHKACQVSLLTNEKSADIKIKGSKLNMAKTKLTAIWGEIDGNLFNDFNTREVEKLMIVRKGDYAKMINQNEVTMMIYNKENIIKRRPQNKMFGHSPFENLFSDKYFIYNHSLSNCRDCYYYMHIYESPTLRLNKVIPFVSLSETNDVEVSASASSIMVVDARNYGHQVKLTLME